jgi:hypothetical protein
LSAPQFVYVADRGSQSLVVYPFGDENAAPIRSIPLGDKPAGVATDSSGNVYVATYQSGVVEYTAGATSVIRSMTAGIIHPTALYVDASNTLWIANDYVSGSQGITQSAFIGEYPPGATTPTKKISMDLPGRRDFHISGFTFDATGRLFICVWDSPVSLVISNYGGTYQTVAYGGAPASIAFSNDSLVVAGPFTQTFTPSGTLPYPEEPSSPFDTLHAVGYIQNGPNGSLYVPISDPYDPRVVVMPPTGTPYNITQGLSSPISVAIGV